MKLVLRASGITALFLVTTGIIVSLFISSSQSTHATTPPPATVILLGSDSDFIFGSIPLPCITVLVGALWDRTMGLDITSPNIRYTPSIEGTKIAGNKYLRVGNLTDGYPSRTEINVSSSASTLSLTCVGPPPTGSGGISVQVIWTGSKTSTGPTGIYTRSGGWATAPPTITVGSYMPPPTFLMSFAVSYSEIDLSWTDNSSSETGFKIERSDDGGNSFGLIATVGANVTRYQNIGLYPNTRYYYRVRATDAYGDSQNSNVTNSTTLAVPVILTASAVSNSQINLSWQQYPLSIDNTEIVRSLDSTCISNPACTNKTTINTNNNSRTFSDTGLTANTTYYYRIRVTGGGSSGYSNIENAKTPLGCVDADHDGFDTCDPGAVGALDNKIKDCSDDPNTDPTAVTFYPGSPPRLKDIINPSTDMSIDFADGYVAATEAGRHFTPKISNITPFDNLVGKVKFKICDDPNKTWPIYLMDMTTDIRTNNTNVVSQAPDTTSNTAPLKFISKTTSNVSYQWTLPKGWDTGVNSPVGITSGTNMETLVTSIANATPPVYFRIEQGAATPKDQLVTMNACVQLWGADSALFSIAYGREAVLQSPMNLINDAEDLRKNAFNKIDPTAEFPLHFSYFADLMAHTNFLTSSSPPRLELYSICQEKSKYVLFTDYFSRNGDTVTAGSTDHFGGKNINIVNSAYKYITIIHEVIGHAIAGLWDEYSYGPDQQFLLYAGELDGSFKPQKNCVMNPSTQYLFGGILYGALGFNSPGCTFTKHGPVGSIFKTDFYRPSDASIMNSLLHNTGKFNTIGCGYAVSKIADVNLNFAMQYCKQYLNITP